MNQPSELNPNYWDMGLASIPCVVIAAGVLAAFLVALTDRRLPLRSRLLWALLILAVPLIGAVLYAVLRARTRSTKGTPSG
ncbi:PLDc N-terminal domain-containing protein [Arthrobacter sp. RCC_34]|uniref:PLDc N-terminal domain-containing protein n=1 Tax=Arthrobacter sp. RCC_34 TaxID=3239230 RepID=UPI003523AE08